MMGRRGKHLDNYRVDPVTGCWLPTNEVKERPSIMVDGRRMRLHVYVYERTHGPLPPGHVVDHICRNNLCFNEKHLVAVTQSEHARRHHREGHYHALTFEERNRGRDNRWRERKAA